jgi:hypothetical protein
VCFGASVNSLGTNQYLSYLQLILKLIYCLEVLENLCDSIEHVHVLVTIGCLLSFGVYLLDCIYSQSYSRLYVFGCRY